MLFHLTPGPTISKLDCPLHHVIAMALLQLDRQCWQMNTDRPNSFVLYSSKPFVDLSISFQKWILHQHRCFWAEPRFPMGWFCLFRFSSSTFVRVDRWLMTYVTLSFFIRHKLPQGVPLWPIKNDRHHRGDENNNVLNLVSQETEQTVRHTAAGPSPSRFSRFFLVLLLVLLFVPWKLTCPEVCAF